MSSKKRPSDSAVITGLQSTALICVIIGKILISLALVYASIQVLEIGYQMLINSPVAEGSRALFSWQGLEITASGFDAVIMNIGFLFGFLAYLCRPKLTVQPVALTGKQTVSDSDDPSDPDGCPPNGSTSTRRLRFRAGARSVDLALA